MANPFLFRPKLRTVCQAVTIESVPEHCQRYATVRYYRAHNGLPYDYCPEHGQEIEAGIGVNPALRQLWGRQHKIPDK